MHYVLFLLISLVWSASFILMKKATLGFTPLSVAAWRCIWGAIVLGILCWRNGQLAIPQRRLWGRMTLVTLLGCSWPYAVQPVVVARQGSALMALVVSFVPLATVLASIPLLGEWPTWRQVTGVFGALCCLALLLADGIAREIAAADLALAVTVPCGYSVATIVIRGWLRDVPTLTLTFYLLVGSAVVLLPLCRVEPQPSATTTVWWLAGLALATLGVVGTGLATFWFNLLIRDRGPLFAGMVTNLVPIGAVLWGWADNEYVSPWQFLALAGIVVMVAWVQMGAAKTSPLAPR